MNKMKKVITMKIQMNAQAEGTRLDMEAFYATRRNLETVRQAAVMDLLVAQVIAPAYVPMMVCNPPRGASHHFTLKDSCGFFSLEEFAQSTGVPYPAVISTLKQDCHIPQLGQIQNTKIRRTFRYNKQIYTLFLYGEKKDIITGYFHPVDKDGNETGARRAITRKKIFWYMMVCEGQPQLTDN